MESIKHILEFKKTCVSYTKQTMAVKYVSAAIERNTITAIMGPSGCGKLSNRRFQVDVLIYIPPCFFGKISMSLSSPSPIAYLELLKTKTTKNRQT